MCSTESRGVRINPLGSGEYGPIKTRKFKAQPDQVSVLEERVVLFNNKIMKYEGEIHGYEIYSPSLGSGATW